MRLCGPLLLRSFSKVYKLVHWCVAKIYITIEDHNVDIAGLDIAVNAVATAVKDFFFKRLPPVLPEEQMTGMFAHSYHHQDFFKWATRIMKYKGMKNKGMIDNLPSF